MKCDEAQDVCGYPLPHDFFQVTPGMPLHVCQCRCATHPHVTRMYCRLWIRLRKGNLVASPGWLSAVLIPSQVAVKLCLYFIDAEMMCGLVLSSAEGIQQVCLQDQKDGRRHTSHTLPWHDVTAKSSCRM
jgi:hypothetical protein